jgi:hypothetical protein
VSYECSCDFEPAQFHHTYRRKAGKLHHCVECGAPIHPGEAHRYDVGKWDGEVTDYRTCSRCDDLATWARISVPCFCYAFTLLHDSVREMVSEVRLDVPGFVMEWGRRMVAIRQAQRARAVLQ